MLPEKGTIFHVKADIVNYLLYVFVLFMDVKDMCTNNFC